MQYLVSVIDDGTGLATPDEEANIDAFNDRLKAEGHWVFAGGLGSPDPATVVDNRGDEAVFTDGPFLESKEYLAGFWIIEAADLDVALKLAAEGSKACNRKIEVRPFLSLVGIGEAVTQAHHEEWVRVVAFLTGVTWHPPRRPHGREPGSVRISVASLSDPQRGVRRRGERWLEEAAGTRATE